MREPLKYQVTEQPPGLRVLPSVVCAPMRWALLGADDETRLLARMFAAAPGLDLITLAQPEWESLLARDDFEAVVVAHGTEESLRGEQLRKLVGAGVSVVAMHPAVDVLTAYEIEVIRRDAGGTIMAFAPGWQHPAWDILCDLVTLGDGSPLGQTDHVSFDRHIVDRQRAAVLTQFGQDVRILRRLLGDITSVNAVGVTRNDGSWSSLTVHFTSESGRSASWSIAAPGGVTETRVNLSGSLATATLVISGSPGDETWELRDSVGYHEVFPHWNDAVKLVEQVRLATQGRSQAPSWSDACLDLEIAEAAEKSLRRKRAIDLHTTERSEEKTFKGVMAAAGCLVLLAILLAFFGLALWDGFRSPFRDASKFGATAMERPAGMPPETHHGWPLWARLWPVYPVLAFLLLQLLLLITRRSNDESASTTGKSLDPLDRLHLT